MQRCQAQEHSRRAVRITRCQEGEFEDGQRHGSPCPDRIASKFMPWQSCCPGSSRWAGEAMSLLAAEREKNRDLAVCGPGDLSLPLFYREPGHDGTLQHFPPVAVAGPPECVAAHMGSCRASCDAVVCRLWFTRCALASIAWATPPPARPPTSASSAVAGDAARLTALRVALVTSSRLPP